MTSIKCTGGTTLSLLLSLANFDIEEWLLLLLLLFLLLLLLFFLSKYSIKRCSGKDSIKNQQPKGERGACINNNHNNDNNNNNNNNSVNFIKTTK